MPDLFADLTFALTLALGETGRRDSNLDRAKILMDSCTKFVSPAGRREFLVVTRPQVLSKVQRNL